MQTTTPRLALNILTRDVAASTEFYRRLCGFAVVHSNEWQTVIAAGSPNQVELGLIDWVSEFVPRAARGTPAGMFISLIVEDVHAAIALAMEAGTEIVEPAREFEGGAARAVIRDLDGVVIDVATPQARFSTPPFKHVG